MAAAMTCCASSGSSNTLMLARARSFTSLPSIISAIDVATQGIALPSAVSSKASRP